MILPELDGGVVLAPAVGFASIGLCEVEAHVDAAIGCGSTVFAAPFFAHVLLSVPIRRVT